VTLNLAATLVAVSITGCGEVPTPEPESLPDGVVIAYALPKTVSLHAPVPLTITVTNGTANSVHLALGTDGFGRSGVAVTRPNSTRIAIDLVQPRYRVTEYATWPGDWDLPPGESLFEGVVLNEWIDFSALGVYRVDMRFSGAVQGANYTPIPVDRTPIRLTVQVLPRDAHALDELAKDLTGEIQQPIAERAMRAMKNLEYLDDPIAIPYWSRIVAERKGHYFAADAVRALERLGSDEARAALELAARSDDPQTAFQAGVALSRLAARTAP
jgi:hypothetical protein